MGTFERIIRALIYLCFIVMAYYVILWVLQALGIALPPHVPQILMVILVLVAILILVRLLYPVFSNQDWWGTRPPPPRA